MLTLFFQESEFSEKNVPSVKRNNGKDVRQEFFRSQAFVAFATWLDCTLSHPVRQSDVFITLTLTSHRISIHRVIDFHSRKPSDDDGYDYVYIEISLH